MAEKSVAVKKSKGKPGKETPAAVPSLQAPLSELRHRMDRMFDDFMGGWPSRGWTRDLWSFEPFEVPSIFAGGQGLVDVRFDVAESDDAVEITAELPGLDEKDVEVTLSDGVMTIRGEKKVEEEKKEKDHYLSERRYGSFMRSFRVPDSVNQDQIKANFEKGVLKIDMPKRPEAKAKAKKIAISKK